MSILIKGMEMPKNDSVIMVYSDGSVSRREGCYGSYRYVPICNAKAFALPAQYGRLIDADELLNQDCDVLEDHSCMDYIDPAPIWGYSREMIENAPTIVEEEWGATE